MTTDAKLAYGRKWRKEHPDYGRKWHKEHPGYMRTYDLARNYGKTPEWYAQTLAAQDNRCAISRVPLVGKGTTRYAPVIDHNRETGQVREILANRINLGLGLFNHDPELLIAAAEYLLRHAKSEEEAA